MTTIDRGAVIISVLAVGLLVGCDRPVSVPAQGSQHVPQRQATSPEQVAAAIEAERRANASRALQEGIAAYNAGNYQRAHAAFTNGANLGSSMAMSNLGILALNGQGVPVNLAEASQWFQKASDLGLPHAHMHLGYLKMTGAAGDFDPQGGAALLRKAAASSELQPEVQRRVENICAASNQQLAALPSYLQLVTKIMPGKATFCVLGDGDADQCVRTLCQFESENSCDKLDIEADRTDRKRRELKATLAALDCV